MSHQEQNEEDFNFKSLFIPLTTLKVVHFIVIIGIIVYFNSLFNGFVGDDNGQIINNSFIHSAANIPSFFRTSTFNLGNGISGLYYKPLLLTVYSLLYAFFGLSPFAFHLFQVIIHIVNAILVYLLFKKFIQKGWAFMLALIFLIHPINQDAAAYISNLQDTMFVFFGMMGLLFSTSKKTKYSEWIVFMLFVFSLLCKETGIIFFFINIIYIFLFRKERFKPVFCYSALLIIIYSLIHTLIVGTNFITQHDYHIGQLSLFGRFVNIPKIIFYYLYTFIFPKNLAVNYDWVVKELNYTDFYLPLLVDVTLLIVLFLTGIILKKKSKQIKTFIFFAFWFLLGLSIHLQIVPLDGTVSPRWFYLPMIGLLGMIGVVIDSYIKSNKSTKLIFIVFILIIFLFSIRTIIRNADFRDNLTLMCHDAGVAKDNFSLENSCGISLYTVEEYDKAQVHFERSISLAPRYGTNWFGLGITLGKKAEIYKNKELFIKSETAFKNGIMIEPNIPWSYESLGYIYAHYKDTSTAKIFLENSLKKFPNDYSLWLNYAYEEYKAGNKKTALQAITNAYTLNPNDSLTAQYYYNLSNNLPIKINQN